MAHSIQDAMRTGVDDSQEALRLFDTLDPATLDFMRGTWRGAEFPSGHPLDGVLTAAGWFGKRFLDADRVDPLLFFTARRTEVFAVDPAKVPVPPSRLVKLPLRAHPGLHWLVLAARPVVQTQEPKARLRMVACRGVTSAAMIYDDWPIIDVFRRVDPDTVLGMMDMRGLEQPFFFVLRRDEGVATS